MNDKKKTMESESSLKTVPSSEFRQAMRELTGAVCVITVGSGDDKTGFVATSVSSFSADPPILIVCIDKGSSSLKALSGSGRFGVNFMREQDHNIANRFAGFGGIKGKDRYQGAEWTTLPSGTLVLNNALATLDCSVEETIERYDHVIVLARVEMISVCEYSRPLLWFKSKYHVLGDALE